MNFLESYATRIESALQNLQFSKYPETLYEPQKYILNNGGKRVRPVLVLMGCGMCGGEPDKAIPAAIAVELVHNFTLIHDDIMDQANHRRGGLTIHKKWDVSTAILSGDSLFVNALLQLQKLPKSVDYRKINCLFLEGVNKVCEGQAMDMAFEKRDTVTSDEYLEMIGGKTAALISTSLKIGGVTAGAKVQEIETLGTIGYFLGLAFQIQDDWLDVVADPEKFGKKQGGDISEGKKTFLMLRTLEACNSNEREWLLGCLKKRPLSQKEIEKVINLYKKYAITDETRELMTGYYQKAEKALQKFGESNYKRDLQQLITYLQNRDY